MVNFLKLKYLKKIIAKLSSQYVGLVLCYKIKFLPIVIKVEGGLGGQLLNVWLIDYLKESGFLVVGDYSYFTSYNGTQGVSSWKWQAEPFGYQLPEIEKYRLLKKTLSFRDCVLKFSYMLMALHQRTEVYKVVDDKLISSFEILQLSEYLVIHQRKGDYLNVSSYIINDQVIIDQLSSLNTECQTCVYLSDGVISNKLKGFILEKFRLFRCFDDNRVSPELSHLILSKAEIAIISNSQFSLSSGVFARKTIFPPKWNGNKDWDIIYTSYIHSHNEN